MKTTTLEWHEASSPPDDDTTVLCMDSEECLPGYHSHDGWYDTVGAEWKGVRYWAHMPSLEEVI